jgi:putative ABC transport system permease protein
VLDLDTWQEILDTIRANKLRTFLTGFSVAWGIFMLIVLLGSGEGLHHGVEYEFRDDAINSIWIWPGNTSIPYKGLGPGRTIQLTNEDHDDIRSGVAGVEHITSRFYISGTVRVRYRDKTGSFDVRAVHPGHLHVEKTIITAGRFINPIDLRESRKVAAIGAKVQSALFGKEPALGKEIEVNGVAFKVVGIFTDEGAPQEIEKIYLPITTAQRAFGGGNRVASIMVTTGQAPLAETSAMAQDIHRRLAQHHTFSTEDPRAVFVSDNNEQFARIGNVILGIRIFVWIVGLGTILAGIVGVSNIMLITVRERTREIGVRKALGATPASIVSLVLKESILITSVAGYVGLVLGIGVLELAAKALPQGSFFRNPEVDLSVALQATLLLITAGLVAGFVPARNAAAVRPVEALRSE